MLWLYFDWKGEKDKALGYALVIPRKSASALDCGSHAAAFFCAKIKHATRRFFPQRRRFA
ncbi:MAG: hypothetical protein N3D11_05645 [Candidatus Sumerlaeia bacterium]|nr:hypothetical protein [Candidatus Sumerlaeia bacterium]